MAVLPAASNHAIPEVFHPLMTDEDSEIIDYYPTDFPIDLNGKKFAWQGVALLPFIDEKRLLDAMATKYPLLSAEDAARNETGRDVLMISDRHPLYEEVAVNFYSKRQGSPKHNLTPKTSQGLAGKVEKNENYLPQSALIFPLNDSSMPDLEVDHSISVCYEMPKSSHIHKSMLLRGAKLAQPVLTREDIEATKSRASTSGRSYGGAPLGGNRNNGRGRGGHINYSDSRPNPFAAHLNPGFVPPHPSSAMYGHHQGPPVAAQQWGPPPPPSQGSHYNQRGSGPPQGYGYGPPPPYGANGYHGGGGPPPPPPQNGYFNSDQGYRPAHDQYRGPPQDYRYNGHNGYNRR